MSVVDWSMVEKNMGLVFHTALRYADRGYTRDELIGEAALGCLRASQLLDESKARYSTYADRRASQRIARSIWEEDGVLRLPEHTRKEIWKFQKIQSRLAHEWGRFPTDDEVLDAMGESDEARGRIPFAMRAYEAKVERDRLGQVNKTAYGSDAIDEVIRLERAEILGRAMARLKPDHREVLVLRFGLDGNPPLLFEDIARRKGYSNQRAQQVVKTALVKLEWALKAEGMDAL